MAECSYIKIWPGLSGKDRQVAWAIARTRSHRSRDIRRTLGWTTNQYNPYRMRLIRKGLLDGETYGEVSFTLPQFDRFIREYALMLGLE